MLDGNEIYSQLAERHEKVKALSKFKCFMQFEEEEVLAMNKSLNAILQYCAKNNIATNVNISLVKGEGKLVSKRNSALQEFIPTKAFRVEIQEE